MSPVRVVVNLPGAEHEVVIRNVGPTSDIEAAITGGERNYRWSMGDRHGIVQHHRSLGWAALLSTVFTDMFNDEIGTGGQA